LVIWSKILPIAALGVGVLFLVNAFTRPAHASQTASALGSSVSVLGTAGESIAGFGQGIGSGLAGLFQPLWEIANLFERYSALSGGAANVSPVAQEGLGYWDGGYWRQTNPDSPGSSATYTVSGSSSGDVNSLSSVQSGSGGQFGGTDTSSGWGL
jgi:hypothetical protein